MRNRFYSQNRRLLLIFLDGFTIVASFIWAFYLMFDFSFPEQYLPLLKSWLPLIVMVQLTIFNISGFYKVIWRFTSLWELLTIIKYVTISSAIGLFGIGLLTGFSIHPGSVLLSFYFFNVLFICFTRVSVRVYFSHFKNQPIFGKVQSKKRLILIGAGKTGAKISREILDTVDSPYVVVGFIDDDLDKRGARLHGIQVLGTTAELEKLVFPFDELLITAPAVTGDDLRRIISACKSTGKRFKTVPSLAELIDKDVSVAAIRDVSYLDLLGREEVKLDMNSIEELLYGKRVLITGAGGSIGSELVQQCLAFGPSEIICMDYSEEKIFDIMAIAEMTKSNTIIKPVLGNINQKNQVEKVFNENRPQIVFHAAAYKHVPIQEIHPWTAVRTNVGGTLGMLELADKYHTEKFVLVSTDKAVNPVNVMGATKRLAEILIQSMNSKSDTEFLAVRFGNVMGSSGSAIPIFEKQIQNGGPVTITHPEMTRYFMSIQEASQLILQSGAIGKGGEVILLEMGKPIKIDQLARDLIKLSGLEPEIDIPVVYSGLRPGEKLYEELQSLDEKLISTSHKKIMILKDENHRMVWEELKSKTHDLIKASEELDSDKIQIQLKALLPRYAPRSFLPTANDDRYESYNIKGEA
ncbi:MAG: polysaccharide biosynthesis protein [Candidatus Marinimicrobia bacterium]|nr:polysaccharide biosynthesis protein [Candidatus Neomarinimicrobiota bacterium]